MTNASGVRPRVAFVVNGTVGSAMGDRARAFASRLAARFDITMLFRERGRIAAIGEMLRGLRKPVVLISWQVARMDLG